MAAGRVADGVEIACAEEQAGPAAEDDPGGVEQIDQPPDARAEVAERLRQDAGSLIVIDDGGEGCFLAGVFRDDAARFAETVEDRLGADVGFETAFATTPAGAPAGDEDGVPE